MIKYLKIKVKKVEEREDATHPHNICVGFEKTFERLKDAFTPPEIGNRFCPSSWWSTSPVMSIINDNKFVTLNSVYEWEIVEEFEKELVAINPKELEILLRTIV